MFFNTLCLVLLIIAAAVVFLNWGCVVVSLLYKRQGIKRHVSTVPLVAQVFVILAATVQTGASSPWLPGWAFWVVACADVALWSILCLPLFLLRRRFSPPA